MTHVLILQHEDGSPGGVLLDVLAERGLATRTVRPDRGEQLPDRYGWAFVVALGARAAADSSGGWIADERTWLRRAHEAGTPILGLSFGAQTLALALGGDIRRAARPERGLIRVSSSVPDLVPEGPWTAWHDDAIVLPPEAELLADNDSGPQAFRAGRHLGIQFHPEVTPAIAGRWVLHHDGLTLDTQGLLEGLARENHITRANARRLFSAFIDQALGVESGPAELAAAG
jgi:GMP synthase (glutamine-hydrolysing)